MNSSGEKRMEAARKPRYDQRFVRWCREYGYGAWIGGALAVLDHSLVSWEWWFLMLPTVFLVAWKCSPNVEHMNAGKKGK